MVLYFRAVQVYLHLVLDDAVLPDFVLDPHQKTRGGGVADPADELHAGVGIDLVADDSQSPVGSLLGVTPNSPGTQLLHFDLGRWHVGCNVGRIEYQVVEPVVLLGLDVEVRAVAEVAPLHSVVEQRVAPEVPDAEGVEHRVLQNGVLLRTDEHQTIGFIHLEEVHSPAGGAPLSRTEPTGDVAQVEEVPAVVVPLQNVDHGVAQQHHQHFLKSRVGLEAADDYARLGEVWKLCLAQFQEHLLGSG